MGVWARRIHLSSAAFPESTLSWHRATVSLVKKWLYLEDVNLSRATVLTHHNGRELASTAALRYFREKLAAKKSVVMKNLVELHEHDTELAPAPHLLLLSATREARTETLLRTGALLLNDRVSKFAPERPETCQACDSNEKETYVHFLWDCEGLDKERNSWILSRWRTFLREPHTVVAALRVSPHFEDLSKEEVSDLLLTRVRSLHRMYLKRCALQALRSRTEVQLPLGVEATA